MSCIDKIKQFINYIKTLFKKKKQVELQYNKDITVVSCKVRYITQKNKQEIK